MRLATVRVGSGTRAARAESNGLVLLREPDVRAVLESGDGWQARAAAQQGERLPWAGTSFAPVVVKPDVILQTGRNFVDHIEEGGVERPASPTTLTGKYARSLIGAFDPIAMPPESECIDLEAELAVVIGKPVRRASTEEAAEAIAGYTVCNDTSVRDWQFRAITPMPGKIWERMTPVGPVMVTPDEIDNAKGLRIQGLIDDRVMQDTNTDLMLFSPAQIVAFMSTFLTLTPGDLVLTGTCGGSGHFRKPPVYIKPGQTVRIKIERIGELVNRCVPEADWTPGVAP